MPSSAGVYHWASITPGPKYGRICGWFAGWWNTFAWICATGKLIPFVRGESLLIRSSHDGKYQQSNCCGYVWALPSRIHTRKVAHLHWIFDSHVGLLLYRSLRKQSSSNGEQHRVSLFSYYFTDFYYDSREPRS